MYQQRTLSYIETFWHESRSGKCTSLYNGSSQYIMNMNDVMKWKHFLYRWSFVGEYTGHRWVVFTEGQWCGALLFSLTVDWKSYWTNSRRQANSDVLVLIWRHRWIAFQWCRALMFPLMVAWTNGWANSRKAGWFRCISAHLTSL